jgi:hypothetical protein
MIAASPVPERSDVTRAIFEAEVVDAGRPVVLRGLVADWPIVRAAKTSDTALVDHLLSLDAGQPVAAFEGDPSIRGRYFYSDDLKGFNFERIQLPLPALLERLTALRDDPDPPGLYAGAIPAPTHLPRLLEEAAMPLLDPGVERLTSLWLGNRTRTAAHWDLSRNLACVVAGRRRFTLFPPDQIANLYVGPVDFTLAGQPISLVDLAAPDLERFPRFAEAMAHAQTAVLEPGDVLFIPGMWFHHVEGLDPIGALVNFWWREAPPWAFTPSHTLLHALLTLRDLPADERAAWRAFFDHYIFRSDEARLGDPMAHIPMDARGLYGPMTPQVMARLRATLMRPLSR